MAQQPQYSPTHDTNYNHAEEEGNETKDRGMLDLLEKKEEEKPNDEMSVGEFAEARVTKSEEKKEEQESSDEEEGEGGERKKKTNKGLTEKTKERITAGENKEELHPQDVVVDGDHVTTPSEETEEKKSSMEKIKEKLPGAHKIIYRGTGEESAPVDYQPAETDFPKDESEEKKGFMEKIKEKLPTDEESPPVDYQPAETDFPKDESEEKKGFMEKIKEKLPTDEESAPVDYQPAETDFPKDEPEEKKGFMEKIKEKLPGQHKTGPAAETQEKEINGVTN